MIKIKLLLFLLALIIFNTGNFIVCSQEKPVPLRQIELRNTPYTNYIHVWKLVKVDYKSADTIIQLKGKISEITDSSIVVNGTKISLGSINVIYTNHLLLGTTFIIIGIGLIAFDLFEISIMSHYGNNVPALFLLPTEIGVPFTVAGLISILHWKKYDLSKGWVLSIK